MKKIILLLLSTIASYGQAVFDEGIQITNTESATATKVNVQEANGKVNTQTIKTGFNKNIGLGGSDVVGANTLLNQYSTTPIDWTATAFNSGQVVFYVGKQWVSKTVTVAGDVPAASSKWEEITFDALANKTVIVDAIPTDGSNNAVSSNGVFDGLALKSNIGHTHVASQITDLSKASVGLGNVDNTSDLSKPLSTATQTALNGKENSFTKNTAFNKPFGITAGTVVEGGTLGSNAYTSTAYLPLSGGTVSGNLFVSNSNYSVISVKGTNSGDSGGGVIRFENQSKSFAEITGEVESAGNGVVYFRSLTNGVTSEKLRINSNGNATFSGTISASPATTANQVVVKSQLDAVAARPYKVYTALLSQTGTNEPTATVLENTLGGTIVWSRTGVGRYTGTLNNAFTLNKTIVFLNLGGANSPTAYSTHAYSNSISTVLLQPNPASDNLLSPAAIEIRVYN